MPLPGVSALTTSRSQDPRLASVCLVPVLPPPHQRIQKHGSCRFLAWPCPALLILPHQAPSFSQGMAGGRWPPWRIVRFLAKSCAGHSLVIGARRELERRLADASACRATRASARATLLHQGPSCLMLGPTALRTDSGPSPLERGGASAHASSCTHACKYWNPVSLAHIW